MLGHSVFYYHSIRKLVVAFGSLFQDIYIERRNKDHELLKHILVPLSYGPKQKYLVRIKENPVLEAGNVAIVIPRMAFQIDGISYNPARKLQSRTTIEKTITNNEKRVQYVPVPYDINFSLYILVDNAEDGTQILEQILPFFSPEFTVTVNTLPDLGISHDIPVTLNTASVEDNFDTEFSDKRVIVWTLGFTMQGWIFGPVSEDNVGIIRRVITDFHNVGGSDSQPISDEDVAKTPRHVRITIDPDPIDASPDDEFGYNTTIEDFNDNKKRNPVTGEDEEIP